MAGACTALGVRVNSSNQVEAAVDRKQAWPYSGSASTKSGLRVDPNTGLLWAPPDQLIKVIEATAPGRTAIPDDTEIVTLNTLSLEMEASKDHDQVMFRFDLSGGFQGYRTGSGNFWATYRHITTFDNGVAQTFSDWEEVGAHENNAGGATGSSTIGDSFVGMDTKPGGTKFKVQAVYQMRPLAFTASGVNGFSWRPPRLQLMQFSIPQALP